MQARVAVATKLAQPDGHFYTVAATITRRDEPEATKVSPLAVYRRFQHYLFTGEFDRMHEVVDLEHYTENCVGFTPGWVTGFSTALDQYTSNVASAMTELQATEENVVEGVDFVVISQPCRSHACGSIAWHPRHRKTLHV